MDKITNSEKPVIAGIFHDEFDFQGERFFKEYEKDNKNLKLLIKSADQYEKSSNPDGLQISNLLKGLYHFKTGENEKKKPKTSLRHLQKARKYFEKINNTEIELKRTDVLILDRTLRLQAKPSGEIFLQMANLHKELGQESDYHTEMWLYELYSIPKMNPTDKEAIEESLKNLGIHAERSGRETLKNETKITQQLIRAGTALDPKTSLEETQKLTELIEKSENKHLKEETEARLAFTKAMLTPQRSKRNELLIEAAKIWDVKGNFKQVEAAIKLTLPLPVKVGALIKMIDDITNKQRVLSKDIHKLIEITPGTYALWHHHSYIFGRLKDIETILERMGKNKKRLIELAIKENKVRPTKYFKRKASKILQPILAEHDKITHQMKLDMESLYIFGNMLLDQWTYFIWYALGLGVVPTHPFFELANKIQAKEVNGPLEKIKEKHADSIFWLLYQIRFYRNKFIEHVDQPRQVGNTASVYGDDFQLFIPTPPGWEDNVKVKKILEEIYPLAPEALRNAPDDYWEKKNLKRVLEVTFMNIGKLEKQSDREKVWNAWNLVGGTTPSYDLLAAKLLAFMLESTETISTLVHENPSRINLGLQANA